MKTCFSFDSGTSRRFTVGWRKPDDFSRRSQSERNMGMELEGYGTTVGVCGYMADDDLLGCIGLARLFASNSTISGRVLKGDLQV